MRTTVIRRAVMAACLVPAIALSADSAHAYNWKTHVRMVETAVQVMQPSTFPASTPAPSGVDPTQWSNYLTAIHGSVAKLQVLKSGLPNAGTESTGGCDYNPQDNMSEIPNVRIEDMAYLPLQGGQVVAGSVLQGAGACSEAPIQCTADNALRVGRTLGWQGASADDHLNDTVLWNRPTSIIFLGAADTLATEAFDLIGGALLFPFVCVFELFSGGSCSVSQAVNLANQYNPITELAGLVPGIMGPFSGTDYNYVGFWHFVDAAAGSGMYNPTRGMLYESAGPNGIPGAIDFGIMVGGDLIGLSLDASESDGVSRYGQYDAQHRDHPHWQASNIGHTEFSPISNMAMYGWQQYISNPNTALPLTWPLHALGDAAEPQHAAGTTGWGHRPYEDEVDNLLDAQLLPPPNTCTLGFLFDPLGITVVSDSGQPARILQQGFNFWNRYNSQFGTGLPIQAMVIDEANQTLALANSGGVYNDAWSTEWHLGDKGDADEEYAGYGSAMKSMLEMGTGAIIAFLTAAAQQAKDPGVDTGQQCIGTATFNDMTGMCNPGGSVPGTFQSTGSTICASGSCGTDSGVECAVADMCSDASPCQNSAQICSDGCCFDIPR